MPQHHKVPSVAVAQASLMPSEGLAQLVAVPTWAGVQDPTGSKPFIHPQHHRVLSVAIAQVWPSPAETAAQFVAVPTWVGVEMYQPAVAPMPASPLTLAPQHQRAPPVVIAQVAP